MSYRPGDVVRKSFATHVASTGALTNADSTPTGVLVQNGSDSAVTVSVTHVGTGRYVAAFTIPTHWMPGDDLELLITAIVSTITGAKVIWEGQLSGQLDREDLHEFAGYVVLDTVLGDSSSSDMPPGEDGTWRRPTKRIRDAKIIADEMGVKRIHVVQLSSVTLVESLSGYELVATGPGHFDLALASQVIASRVVGAHVSGVGAPGSTQATFDRCLLGNCTLPSCQVRDSEIAGTITLLTNTVGDDSVAYVFRECVANGGELQFSGAADTIVRLHLVGGNITIKGMDGSDVLSVTGFADSITFDSTCIGGSADLHGFFHVTDNSGSGCDIEVTEVYHPRLSQAADAIVTGSVDSGATTTSVPTTGLSPAASSTDQFKGQILCFDRNTLTAGLRGAKTDITASTSGGVLTVTTLPATPVAGDTFTIQ